MNKKGFTLIELLGVIVVLAIVVGLVVVSMTGVIGTGKKGTYSVYEKAMLLGAQNYLSDYPNQEPIENSQKKIYLKELISNGYIEALKDPNAGNCNDNEKNSYVVVKRVANLSDKYKTDYKICLICKNGDNVTYITEGCSIDEAENITLYTINYQLNNGIVNGNNPLTYSSDTNSFTLINPTKKGYTFIGWTGSNGNTMQKDVTIPKGSTGNKNYIANWEVNELIFTGTTINRTYGDSTNTSFTGATNGTDSYTYIEKGGTAANYASVSGTTITIQNTIPVGTYTYIVTATDNNSGATKDATFTINIGKKATTMSLSSTSATVNWGESTRTTVTTDGDGPLSCTVNSTSRASCRISGTTVTISANYGQDANVIVTISQGEGTNYLATSKTFYLTIKYTTVWEYLDDYGNAGECSNYCAEACEIYCGGSAYWGCSTSSANGSKPTGSGRYCHCGY